MAAEDRADAGVRSSTHTNEEEARQMPVEPGKIRNVAVVGHRSTGKTSLVEAMLYQAGAINRLGTIEAGNTTSDWDDDEQKRQMSLDRKSTRLNSSHVKISYAV